MIRRNRKSSRRSYRFERLELRTLLASDMVWNNVNWDPSPGITNPFKGSEAYYSVDDKPIGLNISTSKLVIGLEQQNVVLPDFLTSDFGLAGRAQVYQSSQAITPALLASIQSMPGVTFTTPVFVGVEGGTEAEIGRAHV